VIIIVEKDRVSFAAPARLTIPYLEALTQSDICKKDNVPIWRVDGHRGTIMAGWLKMRANDLVRYRSDIFEKEINLQTLSRVTMPKINEILKNEDEIEQEKGRWTNCYYVACGNKAYEINDDCVLQVEEHDALGIYSDIAVASLDRTRGMDKEQRLRILANEVEAMTGERMLPMVVMDTKTRKIKILK